METTAPQADIGLIGLGVTGQNLVLNMNDRGYTTIVYKRPTAWVEAFLAQTAEGTKIRGAHTLEDFVANLKSPRRVMLLVEAGKTVDDLIAKLTAHLAPGDILIDGGNSHFEDTTRRQKQLEAQGFFFIGLGIAGGAEAVRQSPCLMPGGSSSAWPAVQEMLQSLCAKREDGTPGCAWVGEGGSGHYVQMVHNALAFADMQLLGETYHILKAGLGLTAPELHALFAEW
ncbi:MAG: NAD(P)-binding domain-containing protein, partial [Deltaproteobacteria bacterium]